MMNLSIDCDGVLVDYAEGYIRNWEKMFGYVPKLIDPHHYLITRRYDIPKLSGNDLTKFKASFDDEFWENLIPLPGAVEACTILKSMGFKLYCNTAIDHHFKDARAKNLAKNGFVFEDVLTSPSSENYNRFDDPSPKIENCLKISALAHFDDYLPYFRGLPQNINKILISEIHTIEDTQVANIDVDFIAPDFITSTEIFKHNLI